jgi:2-oxo-4-hydroxy-4-carboxy-5-ureidoimidazoline decarboxylase
MTGERTEVQAFNEQAPDAATEILQPVCASLAWQRVLVASRPFGSIGELAATSDGVLTALGWSDVQDALAGEPGVTPDAVAGSEEAVTYEARFGVPFLIDPTGKTADQLRGALAERLANDDETEQRTVRRELAAIVRLRLAKTFG